MLQHVSALHSFLWLSNILLCGLGHMFIHSSGNEHLSFVQFLATGINAAISLQLLFCNVAIL